MPKYAMGWVPDLPDARDWHFHAPHTAVRALPEFTSNRAKFTSPVYSQGPIGSCGPHSACGDIQWDGDQSGEALRPSRLFAYWVTRQEMGTLSYDSGVSNRAMLKALARNGWCDETLWPYVPERFKEQPPDGAFAQAKTRLIDQYLRVPQVPDQMQACLAAGDPFIFGFTVYSSLMTQAVERTGVVPMPTRNDSVVGGHDVLIVDFDARRRMYVFRNSWGAEWGDKGFGFLPFDYAHNPQLAQDFWTIRWKRQPAPVPPQPQPIPVPPAPSPSSLPTINVQVSFPNGQSYTAAGQMKAM